MPRLSQALHALLAKQRVAALGTSNPDATPFVSMVPFAVDAQTGCIIIHVSSLAPHTRNLQINQNVSLMVMESEVPDAPVHALPRVSMQGFAHFLVQEDPLWSGACSAYLNRFPEAEPMTQFGDFRFVTVVLTGAHQVAGFGAARTIDAATLAHLLTVQASP
jgi:putative heme iron utilization protein